MKKVAILLSLVIFLSAGITAAVFTAREVPVTYDSADADVTELTVDYLEHEAANNVHPDEKPESERELPEDPDGVASIIVTTDLSETESINNVASIVFDYRGYDTMGESFILLTAIAGSYIILKNMKGREEDVEDEE